MKVTIYSQTISKNAVNDTAKRCFTNEQMRVINGVFIDLDECEQETKILNKIITIQDSMLQSKIDLEALYKKQTDYNEELKYQLTASINTQIQRYNALESTFKQKAKEQKRKGILIGTTMAFGFTLTLGLLIFQIIK